MNFVFSIVFLAVWPGGRRCANCRDAHFFERYCDENIFTWKTCKTTMEKKSDPWARSGERPGRGHGSELVVFVCFFLFFHGFLQFGQNLEKTKKKKSSDPWAKSGLSTHKPKKQKTRKTKKYKKKPRLHTPRGGGQMQSVGSCVFCFFVFLFFFFFLVCVWIAIADVPSRDCQALSVVALEARSIHYSTAMFAMT